MSRPITSEQFQSFLTAKGMERDCELCGVNKWAIPVSEVNGPVSMASVAWWKREEAPYYSLLCTNCGNLKLLDALIVEEWVQANG